MRQTLDWENVEVLKFAIDPNKTDFVPDPILLLMKAAINWSWRCRQKLYPACGSHCMEEEKELVVPSTPIPSEIEFVHVSAVPVTPDSEDNLSH